MREPQVDGGERVACRGCGGGVPDIDGPTHPYISASPGCWAVYGRWLAEQARATDVAPRVGGHHVDCYAVQHPDGADRDRRQRQSVAVHLVSLCLLVEHRVSPSGCGSVAASSGAAGPPTLDASAGCWALYGQLLARSYADPHRRDVHQLVVDAYVAQHPVTSGQPKHVRQLALCLMTLQLFVEDGHDVAHGPHLHKRMVANLPPAAIFWRWPAHVTVRTTVPSFSSVSTYR